MSKVRMVLTPKRSALLKGHNNTVDVLVRVQAPDRPDELPDRKPLNLALVLDRSGSMQGRPLEEAKRCAEFMVDSLLPHDYVSVVVYDDKVNTVVPCRQVGQREGLHEAVRAVVSGGMTALYDGWFEGAGQAAKGVEAASVSRVLLLSDGQANHGLTDPTAIERRCAEMAEVGVTTSTYGLGHQFNEDLMVRMARAGHGNSYYGQTAEDLLDPFREEFELLGALCARRLRLELSSPPGVKLEVLNRYRVDADGRFVLPDLAYGAEGWAAVRLTVQSIFGERAPDDESPVLAATLRYEDLQGQEHCLEAELSLPWLAEEAYGAVAADPSVEERLGELQAADLQEKARAAALQGDWGAVDALLAQAVDEAADNPWLKTVVEALRTYAARRQREPLAKEAMYAAHRMRTRLVDPSEAPGHYAADIEADKAGYLRRKLEQGKRLDRQGD